MKKKWKVHIEVNTSTTLRTRLGAALRRLARFIDGRSAPAVQITSTLPISADDINRAYRASYDRLLEVLAVSQKASAETAEVLQKIGIKAKQTTSTAAAKDYNK